MRQEALSQTTEVAEISAGMSAATVHNPDLLMVDLRQILAQGRKRLGIFLGAGAPASISTTSGQPLIPTTAGLTSEVVAKIPNAQEQAIRAIRDELGANANIESILSRARALADVLGPATVREIDGVGYRRLETEICKTIGTIVNVRLPSGPNPFSELVGWIGGVPRDHAIEIFTPNYDLLLEEAFERAHIPYFDGFVGAREPFFDPASVSGADLPPRWARLWKIHGSLGWAKNGRGEVIRQGGSSATDLIYPTHLKYDQTRKLPYAALFDRLTAFLRVPDSLLLSCGFSFSDAHLVAAIDEALTANPSAAVIAFQYSPSDVESSAVTAAVRRANVSVYCTDAAVVDGILAPWRLGELPHKSWAPIRASYWSTLPSGGNGFLLGDFQRFARYVALTRSEYSVRDESAGEASV